MIPLLSVLASAAAAATPMAGSPPVFGYEVVATYPHDAGAFCQGLLFSDGILFESTGQYGQSTLRKVELQTGRVLQGVRLSDRLFGEGIAVFDQQVIQLTWRNEVALVFDKQSLVQRGSHRYAGEGWGITSDGQRLVMSDGTAFLRFLDPRTFRPLGRLAVHSGGKAVALLNELEYVDGEIWANVWGRDYVARIAPHNGEVTGWIDLSTLWPVDRRPSPDAVLNGIAFDAAQRRIFVTGKNWPQLFEIRVVERR